MQHMRQSSFFPAPPAIADGDSPAAAGTLLSSNRSVPPTAFSASTPASTAASTAISTPIAVSTLVRLVRERIESGLPLCWVSGEISNLVQAASGHFYFSLKDASAQVRCVMFRQRAQLIGFRPENGQRVEARALATLYEARGEFQLNVEALRRNGVGDLYERFLQLKNKLEGEGLFDPAGKRPLPDFPRCIGIVTSPQAAALRDVLTTLARRAPQVRVVIYPAMVQGDSAAPQLAAAVALAGARRASDGCELLIVCRGGGSLEDLQAFNDEALARAVHACPLPVISGVGHETDFTIADFAADRRAPTPTAAAEMAAPEAAALRARLSEHARALRRSLRRVFERKSQQVDGLTRRLQHPQQRLAAQRELLRQQQRRLAAAFAGSEAQRRRRTATLAQRLLLARPETTRTARHVDALAARLASASHATLARQAATLARLSASLTHLNPAAVLARGFSIVTDDAGRIVRDSRSLEPSQRITVSFHRGQADARIETIRDEHSSAPGSRKTAPPRNETT